VQCNDANVTTGLTWTPTNLTPTATGSVAVSVSASCGGSSKTAQCGNVTVNPANACDFLQSWCPSIDWETGIKWNDGYTAPSSGQCACFFLDKKGGNTQPSCSPYNSAVCTINGEAGSTQNIPIKDGGYYLYGCSTSNGVPNASNADTYKAKPSCTPVP